MTLAPTGILVGVTGREKLIGTLGDMGCATGAVKAVVSKAAVEGNGVVCGASGEMVWSTILSNQPNNRMDTPHQLSTSLLNQVAKNFICNAFVNKKDNKTCLHFVNRSGKKMQLTINAKSSSGFQLTSIEADFPYATAGKTAYEKKYPDKVKPVRYREENFAENTINIAPYALGYISY